MKEQSMADGDTVKMRLTFWRGDQPPGTVIDVPADEVHRWKGFATRVDEPAAEPKPEAKAPAAAKPAGVKA